MKTTTSPGASRRGLKRLRKREKTEGMEKWKRKYMAIDLDSDGNEGGDAAKTTGRDHWPR